MILLPTHLKSFAQLLQQVFQSEGSSYVSRAMLSASAFQEDKALELVCTTWYENDILEFLLKDTPQPSYHVRLVLDLLDIFEQRRQSLSKANSERLKVTAWLIDRKGQPRSPQQVIHLPALQAEATAILEQLTTWNYITSAMLREDLNALKNAQLRNLFISGENALESLGQAAAEQPQYYLGELPEERSLLDKLIPIFHDCQEMPILALTQDVDAFEVFIFPQVLKPIQDIERIYRILNWLVANNSHPQETVVRIYNHYLRMACSFNSFGSNILPQIRLLSQGKNWQIPEKLCDGRVHNGIDKFHVLDISQREVLSEYFKVSIAPQVEAFAHSDEGLDFNNFEQSDSNAQRLEEYFSPWLPFLPSQAIGGFLCLLAGPDPEVQNLAQSYLQRRPFEDLRNELIWAELRTRRFNVQINRGQAQRIRSITGVYFDAPVSDSEIPQTIFVGELSQNVIIKQINLNTVQSDVLKNLIFRSIKRFIRKFDSTGYEAKKALIENIWQRLNDYQNLEIEVAKDFILRGSRHTLRTLSIKSLKIAEQLKEWDNKEFALSDWEKRSHKNNREYEQIWQDIKSISIEIERLIQEDANIQQEVLESVRTKIGEGQYGYHPSNIPFEIFQNADDSIKELGYFIDFIEPERRYYVIKWDDNRIVIMYWGRPINQFIHPDHRNRNFEDRGFGRDLIKMLSFNMSDKSSEETGKFGLGFKTVHLVTQQPKIISGNLSFAVCGGLLPVPITNLQILDDLQNHLHHERPSPEITDGTLIDLALDPKLQSEEIIKEFRQQANLLLVFAKEIRKCKLIGPNFYQELTWSFTPVFGIAEIEYGQIRLPDQLGQWLTHKLLCFRLLAGVVAIALPGNNLQGHSPLKDLPRFWVTTPTKEDSGLRFVINGNFDVTTGRTRLDPNSTHNQTLIQQLGEQLGEKLCQLFQSAAGDNWSSLERILNLNSIDTYKFWGFLWEVLAADWLNSSIEGTTTDLLRRGFGRQSNSIGLLINSYAALPNGLSRQLVCLKNVRYQVKGLLAESNIFAKVASWEQFQQHYSTDNLVHHTIWQTVKKLLETNSTIEVQSLSLSDCLIRELGDHRRINPDTATRLGQMITPNQLREWKTSHQTEYDAIYLMLIEQAVYFKSEDRQYVPARQLLIGTQPDSEEEQRLAAFAPYNRVLHAAYTDHALQLFLACREQRDTVAIEDLVSWAKAANTDAQKQAVLNYLVWGERRGMFANQLKKALVGTWIESYPGIREALEINVRQVQVERANRGEIDWSQVFNNFEPPTTDDGDQPNPDNGTVDSNELLQDIYEWWQADHQIEIRQYNQRIYPIEIEDLQQRLRDRDRGAWLMLFFLGVTHTMGRTKHEQHRDFVNFCLTQDWWQIFSARNPRNSSQQWIGVLNEYMDAQAENTTWYYWMEKFPSIYRIASYLDAYITSFLSAEDVRENFDLRHITAPRSNPAFQGGGADAPPLPLGIGANFVMRELLRLKIIQPTSDVYVPSHCFVPRANVRRLLIRLGCQDLSKPDYRSSRRIYEFLDGEFERLGLQGEPTFHDCFDIPFELYSEDSSQSSYLNLGRIQVREDVGWYEDISDEEHSQYESSREDGDFVTLSDGRVIPKLWIH